MEYRFRTDLELQRWLAWGQAAGAALSLQRVGSPSKVAESGIAAYQAWRDLVDSCTGMRHSHEPNSRRQRALRNTVYLH